MIAYLLPRCYIPIFRPAEHKLCFVLYSHRLHGRYYLLVLTQQARCHPMSIGYATCIFRVLVFGTRPCEPMRRHARKRKEEEELKKFYSSHICFCECFFVWMAPHPGDHRHITRPVNPVQCIHEACPCAHCRLGTDQRRILAEEALM